MLGRLAFETQNRNTTTKRASRTSILPQRNHLARLLGSLPDVNKASETLLQAMKALEDSKYTRIVRQQLKAYLDDTTKTERKSADLALAVERALAVAFGKEQQAVAVEPKQSRRKTGYNVFMTDYAKQMRGESHLIRGSTTRGDFLRLASKAWSEMNHDKKDVYERKANQHNNTSEDLLIRSTTTLEAKEGALISDTEDAAVLEEQQHQEEESTDLDQEVLEKELWANLLESVNLEVAASTTRTTGKKKTYQIYQLAGPAMPISDIAKMRSKLQKAFLTVYDGSTEVTDRCAARYSECRVYATQRMDPKAIWIQINVGRNDEPTSRTKSSGKHKLKRATEMTAVVIPESSLIALTAGRTALRFTPYVLSAMEGALTCSVVGGYTPKDVSKRHPFGDLSGTDPHDLLRAARSIESGHAAGRFGTYVAAGQSSDPISELSVAANASLLSRQAEENRLEAGSKHGQKVANAISDHVDGSLVATNKIGTVVDHSAADKRRRKRDREAALGSDCPQSSRKHVRWEWKGETAAAAASWRNDNDSASSDLPTHKFKCRVVLQGSNVFQGMQALMDAGLMEGPLPDYVKDAPTLGGTISVDHGAIVSMKE